MACKPDLSFLVRVNKVPPDTTEGVLLYTTPTTSSTGSTSKPVNEIRFSGTAMLCFREDPASTVKGLHIDVEPCGSMCQLPPTWDGQVMMLNVSSGTGVRAAAPSC